MCGPIYLLYISLTRLPKRLKWRCVCSVHFISMNYGHQLWCFIAFTCFLVLLLLFLVLLLLLLLLYIILVYNNNFSILIKEMLVLCRYPLKVNRKRCYCCWFEQKKKERKKTEAATTITTTTNKWKSCRLDWGECFGKYRAAIRCKTFVHEFSTFDVI